MDFSSKNIFLFLAVVALVLIVICAATQPSQLIIEPRNPRNHRPKFQAEFHVAEEEPNGPGLGFAILPGNHTPTVTGTHPLGFPMGGR